jgi:hypothetical protein
MPITLKRRIALQKTGYGGVLLSIQKEYVLDDYTRFPSMKETITEVLKEMYFTKKTASTPLTCAIMSLTTKGLAIRCYL